MKNKYTLIPFGIFVITSLYYYFAVYNTSLDVAESSFAKGNVGDGNVIMPSRNADAYQQEASSASTLEAQKNRQDIVFDSAAPEISSGYTKGFDDKTDASSQNREQVRFGISNAYDAVSDVSHIDVDLLSIGSQFEADILLPKKLKEGTSFVFNLQGMEYSSIVEVNAVSKLGNALFKARISDDGFPANMTVYYGKDAATGKIYTRNGSYIFMHNYTSGYIATMYEYKKAKDALHID